MLEIVDHRAAVSSDGRVWHLDEAGRLRAMPAAWTDLVGDDPFAALAGGRAYFRVEDLLQLVSLIDDSGR